MKYKVEIRCPECKKLINETKIIDNKDLADKLYSSALMNPLIGWCWKCDRKPVPKIIKIKEEVIK